MTTATPTALRFWRNRIVSFVAVLGLLVAVHKFVAPNVGIYDVRLIVLSLLFATLAVSLNLINGVTGQFSIGHAAFYLIGAITAGKLSVMYAPTSASGVPAYWLPVVVVAGAIAAGLAGLVVGLPSLRLRGDYLAVATLGFGEIVNVIQRNQDGGKQAVTWQFLLWILAGLAVLTPYVSFLRHRVPKLTGFVRFAVALGQVVGGLLLTVAGHWLLVRLLTILRLPTQSAGLDLGGAYGLQEIPKITPIYAIVLLLIFTLAVSRNLLRSAHGLSFLAVREDELAADATGVSPTKIKVTAFVIGAAIAGMAGAMFAHYNGVISPDDFRMDTSFILVAMVVIGGTGSVTGAACAGIALKLLEEGLRKLQPVPAIHLYAFLLAALAVFGLYRLATARDWLTLRRLGLPLTVFGYVACCGVAVLAYRLARADLSPVVRVGALALICAALIGLLSAAGRKSALPRFGLLMVTTVLSFLVAPLLQRLLHVVQPVENLLGATTYTPSDLRWAVFSIALVLVMILRPQGIMGHAEVSLRFLRQLVGIKSREVATA